MLIIPLTQNQVAIIDDEDYELISQYSWRANKDYKNNNYYAIASLGKKDTYYLMHRLIMNAPNDKEVDHIDGNGLNNTRINLRIVEHKDNSKNQKTRKNSKSKYKGVDIHKNRWRARIRVNYKEFHLGYFMSELDAAKAYDKAAIKYFGEFANTNFKENYEET